MQSAPPSVLAQSFRLARERWDVLSSQASQAPPAGHVHPSAAGSRVDEFRGTLGPFAGPWAAALTNVWTCQGPGCSAYGGSLARPLAVGICFVGLSLGRFA